MKNSRLVFMGSTEFSLASLKKLYVEGFNIVAVYTREPKPTGRHYKLTKTIVHEFAESKNIPVFTPKTFRDEEQVKIFANLKADVALVSAYGLIIPQSLLDLAPFVNIHASLLPRWRGAAPIQRAILSGDEETGISIMKMDDGLDTGDVISMKSVEIDDEMNSGQLSEILAEMGAKMIEETLLNLDQFLKKAARQPEEGACYAHKIDKKVAKFDLSDSAVTIVRKVKAFAPIPGAWTELNGKRLKVLDASLVKDKEDCEDNLVFESSDGKWIAKVVQPEGKKPISGRDFRRGYLRK
ncbi:MAG: methionyl-tRNA formyltransferase [Alphaproteobacteria bacterium]|nr:methionyl-tRNA formyltransferase [Alphaproteobacteria bacterium]